MKFNLFACLLLSRKSWITDVIVVVNGINNDYGDDVVMSRFNVIAGPLKNENKHWLIISFQLQSHCLLIITIWNKISLLS